MKRVSEVLKFGFKTDPPSRWQLINSDSDWYEEPDLCGTGV